VAGVGFVHGVSLRVSPHVGSGSLSSVTPKGPGLSAELNVPNSQPILTRMAKEPESPKPAKWSIYRIAAKAVRLGTVEAPDVATAIEKAAVEYKVPATRLMAIRR
jgi:membrane-bound lytic murein transglycosylase B